MTKIIILLIGLFIPSAKPCLPPQNLPACIKVLPTLEPKLKFANFFLRSSQISEFLILNSEFKLFLPYLDYFLGQKNPTTYLILLQNNYELRANGGFFGSYAKIIIPRTPRPAQRGEGGASTLEGEGNTEPNIFSPEISFQDIYVPDGALVGHVEPPAPIQTAFKQGWFKLRDSDWEPDFPTAATTIRWFLTKGNEINPDLLITLNLSTIEKIIALLGDIYVPEYDLTLTHDNLYALLQNQSEQKAFDGSTQKKDVITAAGRAVIKKFSHLEFDELVKLVKIALVQLNHSNLLVNSTNESVQKVLEEKNWAGKLPTANCQLPNCLSDTVLLVETNLGANKANCCVERKTIHTITKGETEVTHLLNLTLTNKSPLENPDPPRFYGGNYISYLRFYIPENATNIRLTAQPTLPKTLTQYPLPFDGLPAVPTAQLLQAGINQKSFDLKDNYGLREVGFFHLTAAGTSSHVQLSYDLPLDDLGGHPSVSSRPSVPASGGIYQLNILKQHGLESSPQEINLFGQVSNTNLESDFSFSADLPN